MNFKKIASIALLFLSITCLSQHTDVINSNRPSESMSAFAVGKNVIQIDPGIDVYDSNGNLRRVILKNARNDFKHLLQIRRLTNAITPIQISSK